MLHNPLWLTNKEYLDSTGQICVVIPRGQLWWHMCRACLLYPRRRSSIFSQGAAAAEPLHNTDDSWEISLLGHMHEGTRTTWLKLKISDNNQPWSSSTFLFLLHSIILFSLPLSLPKGHLEYSCVQMFGYTLGRLGKTCVCCQLSSDSELDWFSEMITFNSSSNV